MDNQQIEKNDARTSRTGWYTRLRAKKLEFDINGSVLRGKEGYQMSGGTVPLFPGATLDLSSSKLIGEQKDTMTFAEGTGAKIILSPKGVSGNEVVTLDQLRIGKMEDGTQMIAGISSQNISFGMPGKKNIKSTYGIAVLAQEVDFINPVIETKEGVTDDKDILTGAFINESGVQKVRVQKEEVSKSFLAEQSKEFELHSFDFLDQDSEAEEEEDKRPLHERMRGNVEETIAKAGFAKEALMEWLETGKLPANKFEEEKAEEKKASIWEGIDIPIVPGLSFRIALTPSYSFKVGLHFEGITSEAQPGEILPKTVTIALIGSLDASLALELLLELVAGLQYLLEVKGGISAKGELKGALGEGDGSRLAEVKASIILVRGSDGNYQLENNLDMGVHTKLALLGSVGAHIGMESRLFGWEKELYSYTFKEWNLAEFEAALEAKTTLDHGFFKNFHVENSTFSHDNVFKRLREQKNFGFTIEKKALDTWLSEQVEGEEEAITKLGEAPEESERVGGFKAKRKEQIAQKIKTLTTLDTMVQERLLEITKDKKYQTSVKRLEEGSQRHQKRLDDMQKWSVEFQRNGGNLAKEKDAALLYYQAMGAGSGASKERVSTDQESAVILVATKASLIDYEKKRLEEVRKKHTNRVVELKQFVDTYNASHKTSEMNLDKPQPEFFAFYHNLGATSAENNLHRFMKDKEVLRFYEEGRLVETTKKHGNRIIALEGKKQELKLQDLEKPSQEFTDYYRKELKGTAFFANVLQYHKSKTDIMAYEEARIKELGRKHVERIQKLEAGKPEYEGTLFFEDGYKAAGRQAILDYERAQVVKKSTSKDKKSVALRSRIEAYDAYAKLEEGAEKEEKWRQLKLLWSKDKGFLEYQKKHLAEQVEGVTTSHAGLSKEQMAMDIPLLIQYEKERIHYYEVDTKDDKSRQKHSNRVRMLENRYRVLPDEGAARKEGIIALKLFYFSGKIDVSVSQPKPSKNSGAERDLKKGDFFSDESVFEYIESMSDKHGERVKKLQALVTLPEERIWEQYEAMGGGAQFKKVWRKNHPEGSYKPKTEELLLYEKIRLREKVRYNKKKTNHYDRLEELRALENSGSISYEEFLKKYQAMGAGDGYKESLAKAHFSKVTPHEIITYEVSRKQEIAQKHEDRLELLKGFADEMTEANRNAYEEMVRTQHRDNDGALRNMLAKVRERKLGVDSALKVEEILTPNMIFAHEEQRADEIGKKHQERVQLLENSAAVTEEDLWQEYQAAGGGKAFQRATKAERKVQFVSLQTKQMDYEDIMAYERKRKSVFDEKKADLEEPVKALTEAHGKYQVAIHRLEAIDVDNIQTAAKP